MLALVQRTKGKLDHEALLRPDIFRGHAGPLFRPDLQVHHKVPQLRSELIPHILEVGFFFGKPK